MPRFDVLDTPHGDHATTFVDQLRVAWRRKWLIALPLVLIPLIAVFLSLRQARVYEASADVFLKRENLAATISGIPDYSQFGDRSSYAETEMVLARGPQVIERVLRATARLRRGRSLGSVSVTPSRSADLLVFRALNGDPRLASAISNEYAKQFTAYRSQLDTATIEEARREVSKRLDELRPSRRQNRELYQTLVDKEQQLRTLAALQKSRTFVLRRATSAVQVSPKPVRSGVVGAGLGLLFGLGLAFLWHAFDTRLRSADEIAERLGLPLLARIPEPPKHLRRRNQLSMIAEPNSMQAEAFRMLKTNLEFVNLERRARSVMFTSAVESEGKSTTVLNLAVAFARSGTRVVLVDMDLRRPFLDRFLGFEGEMGITDMALGRATMEDALRRVLLSHPPADESTAGNGNASGVEGMLEVLGAGAVPPNPGELAGSKVIEDLLDELRERCDLLLIDAPPLLHVGDGLTLSARVDALVVVTRLNIIRRPTLRELRRVLDTSPASKLGFVLTGAEIEDGYGYRGYYGAYAARKETSRERIS